MIRVLISGLIDALAGLGRLVGSSWDAAVFAALDETANDILIDEKAITHVDTGTLKASEAVFPYHYRNMDAIEIAPGFINPIHGLPSTYYGPIEEQRGGSHAFMFLTYMHWKPIAGARFRSYALPRLP